MTRWSSLGWGSSRMRDGGIWAAVGIGVGAAIALVVAWSVFFAPM